MIQFPMPQVTRTQLQIYNPRPASEQLNADKKSLCEGVSTSTFFSSAASQHFKLTIL